MLPTTDCLTFELVDADLYGACQTISCKGMFIAPSYLDFVSPALQLPIQIFYRVAVASVPSLTSLWSSGLCRSCAGLPAPSTRKVGQIVAKAPSCHSLCHSSTPLAPLSKLFPFATDLKHNPSHLLATYNLTTPADTTTCQDKDSTTSGSTNHIDNMGSTRKASERPEKRVLVRWTGGMLHHMHRVVGSLI